MRTRTRHQFVDLTEAAAETVRRSRVRHGFVCVQTLHTTTAVVVNENEPGLLQDRPRCWRGWFRVGTATGMTTWRAGRAPPDEPANGDAHCQAMLLSASQTLTIHEQRIQLRATG